MTLPSDPVAATRRPTPSIGRAHWVAELGLRLRIHFPLKLAGTGAFTWLFFVAYFHLLRHPNGPVTLMPLTPLDAWVPFQPSMLWAYLSLWVYVGVAPGLQRTFRELVVYGLWVGGLCLAGLGLFWLWPSAVPPFVADVSGHAAFAALQGVDAAGNACPSMHVAVAIFTAIRVERLLLETAAPLALRVLNLLWFGSIAWSTLAVKQHVAIDVAAGALLGGGFALASQRWRPRPSAQKRAHIIDRLPTDAAP